MNLNHSGKRVQTCLSSFKDLTCLTWFFSYPISINLKCDITITMPLSISPVVRNEVKNLPLEWREWRRHQFLVVFGEPLV